LLKEGSLRQSTRVVRRATVAGLGAAVHRHRPLSRAGVLERLFTMAFRGLVYPQIWEDPLVDLDALKVAPDDRILAIASGGCNVLSYLTADPRQIVAVDLNGAHVALGKLKLCALRHLPDYAAFRRFFADADSRENIAAYDALLRDRLDPTSRAYWDGRTVTGRRRIQLFAQNFYRYGLLGRFISAGHVVARLHGVDPAKMLEAKSLAEQKVLFDRHLAPIFDRKLIGWIMRQPASLYGLGIPPAQYRALSNDSPAGIGDVLRQRLERLACGFDLKSNYFAWQAFGRRYDKSADASLPPYLLRENFESVRARADRIDYRQGSITKLLAESPAQSFDCYVFLDAQDWMNDADLNALWTQVTRTAKPGARVIFRTAADERLLLGRVSSDVLNAWTYDEERSRALGAQDRSSIYGAFHLYRLAA
jgi:S-adenosylmethionine-diacylglycerol 3-amino-3-carboxypropyl transferase